MGNKIYLDHAATTYIKNEILEEMYPYLKGNFGNASSIYRLGRKSKVAIENSRGKVANALKCRTEEVFFTSGGTEGCTS